MPYGMDRRFRSKKGTLDNQNLEYNTVLSLSCPRRSEGLSEGGIEDVLDAMTSLCTALLVQCTDFLCDGGAVFRGDRDLSLS